MCPICYKEKEDTGGVILDDKGNQEMGYTEKVKVANHVESELLALREGLKLARDYNRYATEVIQLLGNPTDRFFNTVSSGRSLLIRHISREGNQVTDYLTKMQFDQATEELLLLRNPPP